MPDCGIVILAAGGSSRMGKPKQLLPIGGTSLLMRTIKTAIDSQCKPIVVVLGARHEEIKSAMGEVAVNFVVNPDWETGMGGSIRAGVNELLRIAKVDAILISVCDQPFVSSEMLNRLVHVHFESEKLIAAAEYAGMTGTPVVFGKTIFDVLLQLEDRQGGKAILSRYPDQVICLAMPEAMVDMDTLDDYAQFATTTDRFGQVP